MKIFFSAGEPSGDLHAANLIRALRERSPDIECVGYGGPEMAKSGCELHYDLTSLAVMWILQVLLNICTFFWLVARASTYFRHHRPDAVVLVDYPGFNWWIAARAKAAGIPVFYYAPPQIWAWASWRIKKMRRFVDYVLCALPFEQTWFSERGCRATFVGHPFFDEVRRQQPDQAFMASQSMGRGPIVTLLPGSRTQEVALNLKTILKAAQYVRQAVPDVRFRIASFKPHQAEMARRMLRELNFEAEVHVGRTPELMRLATCTMAVSGSVSLELLHHRKPTVIVYQISPFGYWVQSIFRKVKYITLVNLLAARDPFDPDNTPYHPGQADAARIPFPEYLTCEDKSESIASHVVRWLKDDQERARVEQQLDELAEQVSAGGASRKAAGQIFTLLAERKHRRIPRPHFTPGMSVKSSGGIAP